MAECLADAKLEGVYLKATDNALFSTEVTSPQNLILGLENWKGELASLLNFPGLKYLEINSVPLAGKGLEVLSPLINLTHLRLNGVPYKVFQSIGALLNIESLTIRSAMIGLTVTEQMTGVKPYLKDINFLRELEFLREIDLGGNAIWDVSALAELTFLEWVNLENNQITILPDFSQLRKLKHLNISNNKISSLEQISKIPALEFLNAAFNEVRDFSPLINLGRLKYLNISGNHFQQGTLSLPLMKELRALALDGHHNKYSRPDDTSLEYALMDRSFQEKKLIKDLFTTAPSERRGATCSVVPSLESVRLPEGLHHLVALSLSSQELRTVPDLTHLGHLRYLNLSLNQLSDIHPVQIHPSLKAVDLMLSGIEENEVQSIEGPALNFYSKTIMNNECSP